MRRQQRIRRKAFIEAFLGLSAQKCDLLPTRRPGGRAFACFFVLKIQKSPSGTSSGFHFSFYIGLPFVF
jgi:hypothetical protein